ncbi:MAG: hypothetical protein M3Q74_04505 [Pseudomonadota bacterium]|nr:hypothetical protein [Pseudomonadota bacterium]
MRVGLLLALALVAASVAAPATAQTFENFKRFCLETGGEPEQVLAAAEAVGWDVYPGALIPTNMDLRLLGDPATGAPPVESLLTGFVPEQGLLAPVCTVAGGATLEALRDRMSAWTGFEPGRTARGNPTWIYTAGAEGLAPHLDLVDVSGAELIAAARSRGRLYAVQVRQGAGPPMIVHFSVHPDATISPTH